MRLALVIHALTAGGAERALTALANHWDEAGHTICVLTLAGPHTPFYALRQGVEVRHLDVAQTSRTALSALFNNGVRLLGLRGALRGIKPDLAIGFMDRTNVLTLLATRGLGIPVIATEHTVPCHWPIGAAWERLRRMTYPWAARVVVPTRAGADDFSRSVPGRYEAIPNPVSIPHGEALSGLPHPLLISMGRLSTEKNFQTLLHAFAATRHEHPDWSLAILGEGPARVELEALATRLGLGGGLLLPGNIADPFAWLRAADLFVLTSHFEGFSYALAEAMACGLPSVAVDCPFGPGELLEDGRSGFLVPPQDEPTLIRAMSRLMADGSLRRGMAQAAKERASRFNPEAVFSLWDKLMGSILR